PAPGAQAQTLLVYIDPEVTRIGAVDDPVLKNTQDVNLETCLRDRLDWAVKVAIPPERPTADSYLLASIQRPANSTVITSDMITDLRRVRLNLSETVDRTVSLEKTAQSLSTQLSNTVIDLEKLKQQVARMFWDVSLTVPTFNTYFGDSVAVTATVVNGLG